MPWNDVVLAHYAPSALPSFAFIDLPGIVLNIMGRGLSKLRLRQWVQGCPNPCKVKSLKKS
jgi:hypothetical protein